jgi:hypothetical protein
MTILEEISKELKIKPDELLKIALRTYFEKKISNIESELFLLAKKYGVKNVFEFDEAIKQGKFHEDNSFEDFFKFDNLEAEKERILRYLEKI